MTQKKKNESDREALAGAETRVLVENDEGPDVEGGGVEQAQSEQASGAEAATVLASEDDRTELVTRESVESAAPVEDSSSAGEPLDEMATRVIDPAAPPAIPSFSDQDGSGAETRILDVSEDKTYPPPVSGGKAETAESRGRPSAPRPPAPTPIDSSKGLAPGMILFGEYEIENVLGVGGMGEVYRARHRRLDEHRAIKVMHADLSQKKGASEFFYREAKALLAVRHPAVVHCHDLLSDEAGRVYLIMEMIEGIPLSKKMNDGPLSPDDVALLGARVAHGLSAAHRKGVIHRDVSPDNIVLPNGRVQEAKLIDFGIAKILQEGEGTIIDGFKGKLSYASPEQLGFFGGKIDGRSDFYSLGLVLVAAALGRPMSMGTTVMEAVDARRGFEALPDEIPVGLRSAIAPLLKLDPEDRPKYVDRLFVVPGGIEGATDPGRYADVGIRSGGEAALRPAGQRLGLFAGIGVAALLLMGVGVYFATGGGVSTTSVPSSSSSAPLGTAMVVPAAAPTIEVEKVGSDGGKPAGEIVPAKVAPPPKAVVRRLTASDRIKIAGKLQNARAALSSNQLMSPANDNAYDRYRQVLALDPTNRAAKDGLRAVADRYLSLTNSAAGKGDLDQARVFLARAKKSDPTHPGIVAAESRLSR